MTLTIDGTPVGADHQPFVVAEIGMNHNGNIELGKEMIRAAAEAGADAVKFQTFSTDKFLAPSLEDRDERRQYELSRQDHKELQSVARSQDVLFLSTPFDKDSADLLDELGVPCFKIASSDLTNIPLIEYIAEKNKPIILSTGYATLSEVAKTVETIEATGNEDLMLLHCISSYPTPVEKMNLRAIESLQDIFDVPVGLSDHSKQSPIAPTVATAYGAGLIEKHFTTDNALPGYDHGISENPETFKQMVEDVKSTHAALGSGRIDPTEEEVNSLPESRRSLYWDGSYPAETEIKEEMIIPLRPGGTGVRPERLSELTGCRLKTAVEEGTAVQLGDIDWNQ
jgi:sialic acid synthase SpsE